VLPAKTSMRSSLAIPGRSLTTIRRKNVTEPSIPRCTVIPELAYPDVVEAMRWLCDAFGFTLPYRSQIIVCNSTSATGAVVLTERGGSKDAPIEAAHSVMVARQWTLIATTIATKQHGARILRPPPTDYPMRTPYTAEDSGGHRWTFTQSIATLIPKNGVAHLASCRPPLV